MGNFFTLVALENTKLWKRLSTKIMLMILIVIIIASTSISNYYRMSANVPSTTQVSENWRQDIQKNIVLQKDQLNTFENGTDNRLLIGPMKKSIAEGEYRINNNIKPESKESIWTNVTSFDTEAFYGLIISLFLIISCSALVAGEFSEGTMKMMISRPYKRSEILTAKLMATILYGLVLFATTFLLNFIMLGLYSGFNGMGAKEMMWTSSRIIYIPAVLKTIIFLGLDFLKVLVYVILAFAISAISRSRSIATGVSLFLLFLASIGSGIALRAFTNFSWVKYLPFVTSDFTSIVNTGACIEGTTLAYAIGLSALYSVLFCLAGYIVFEKRDI